MSARTTDDHLIALARHIETHATADLPLATLAARVHLSPGHLQRRFKALFGVSPKAYQDAARLRAFKRALSAGERVLDAALGAGIRTSSQIDARVTPALGMPPSRYRAGAAGITITYLVRRTAFGPLLLAATDRGVCAAEFGTSIAALRARLRTEFPQATLVPSTAARSPALAAWWRALDAHLRGGPRPALPLDLHGTAFQIRVWQFLTRIPRGRTLSYRELAAGVGRPRAVRAAASACAANTIAILVPCHRVIRGDGGLGGYRWGLDRKRALLAAEGTRPHQSAAR